MNTPFDRLMDVKERIAAAARGSGRPAEAITLIAVTKTVPLDRVRPFLEAGIRQVGENRVQEAFIKYSMPSPLRGDRAHHNSYSAPSPGSLREGLGEGLGRPTLHLIGPLQSNKAKKAVELFDLIQTVDRWELALDLDRHAAALGKTQNCLVQIKISDEPSKSGLPPAALPEFLERLKALPHLRIQGLMGIPPLEATGDASRPYFIRLRKLLESSKLDILSIGMSSDFEVAIEEGSTMVRIGTALFGSR